MALVWKTLSTTITTMLIRITMLFNSNSSSKLGDRYQMRAEQPGTQHSLIMSMPTDSKLQMRSYSKWDLLYYLQVKNLEWILKRVSNKTDLLWEWVIRFIRTHMLPFIWDSRLSKMRYQAEISRLWWIVNRLAHKTMAMVTST